MFVIDYKCGLPIFEQIYRSVITLGAAGAFGDSGQLPSVRAVAKELGVNPNTVQKAYSMLERDGRGRARFSQSLRRRWISAGATRWIWRLMP